MLSTGKHEIVEYYEDYTNIDGGRTRYYTGKVKEASADCEILLTITEPTTGLVKKLYLMLDKTAVCAVNVPNNLVF